MQNTDIKYNLHVYKSTLASILFLAIFCMLYNSGSGVFAADTVATKNDNRTLDERVQSLKKEVKSLNRDLFILEEELLFPSSTQVLRAT